MLYSWASVLILTFDCMGLQYTFAFMVEGNALLLII